jgi:hypothetical protein
VRKSFYLFSVILFLSISCLSQGPTQSFTTIEGYPLQVELKPNKNIVMLGEPTFITLEIKTPQNLCPLNNDFLTTISDPKRGEIKVVREDGKPVPQTVKGSTSTLGGCYGDAPKDSIYTRKIFLPTIETFEKVGNYTIIVKQQISNTNKLSKVKNSLTAEVGAQIKIIPVDNAKLGEIIDSLGHMMLSQNADAESLFFGIDDKRTIKYHLQVLERYNVDEDYLGITHTKRNSILKLGEYNDDAILEAIRKNMSSPSGLIRSAVAFALLRSPHPKALKLLLLMRSDENPSVRLYVVFGLGKLATPESTAQLREMIKDEDAKVRTKAQETLDKREQK